MHNAHGRYKPESTIRNFSKFMLSKIKIIIYSQLSSVTTELQMHIWAKKIHLHRMLSPTNHCYYNNLQQFQPGVLAKNMR